MTQPIFEAFPKIPRLNREIVACLRSARVRTSDPRKILSEFDTRHLVELSGQC